MRALGFEESFRWLEGRGCSATALQAVPGLAEAAAGRAAVLGVRSEGGGRSLAMGLRRVLAFLADRASLLAGGGDMRLVSSGAVALPRARPLGLLVLGSTLEPGLKSDP